jgi:type II restriction endonuclease EcoO109I-like protein
LQYVEDNIGTFHQKRISSLDSLSLSKVFRRKNPYLFKAKYVLTAEQIVKGLVDAHISSNEPNLYIDIIEPLGFKAKTKNDEFLKSYAQMINKFTREFNNQYCKPNGNIDWEKLVKFNSSKR